MKQSSKSFLCVCVCVSLCLLSQPFIGNCLFIITWALYSVPMLSIPKAVDWRVKVHLIQQICSFYPIFRITMLCATQTPVMLLLQTLLHIYFPMQLKLKTATQKYVYGTWGQLGKVGRTPKYSASHIQLKLWMKTRFKTRTNFAMCAELVGIISKMHVEVEKKILKNTQLKM